MTAEKVIKASRSFQDPASSHVAAVALAWSQSHAAVDVRRNLPASEPDAKIGH